MMRLRLIAACQAALLSSIAFSGMALAADSVFDFNGNLNATSGPATMSLFNGKAFGSFATDTINGQTTGVYQFPAALADQGLRVDHAAAPNGGGVYVNEFTLGYDIKWTGGSPWAAFHQTNTGNSNDADLFRNPAGGIGISGVYDGTMLDDHWYRVMYAFDLADTDGDGKTLYKYINGALVGTQNPGGLDGRFSLDPFLLILTDNDGDTSAGSLSSFLFTDRVMSPAEIRALGGPTGGGLGGEAPIPEPSTLAFLGFAAVASLRRRKSAR